MIQKYTSEIIFILSSVRLLFSTTSLFEFINSCMEYTFLLHCTRIGYMQLENYVQNNYTLYSFPFNTQSFCFTQILVVLIQWISILSPFFYAIRQAFILSRKQLFIFIFYKYDNSYPKLHSISQFIFLSFFTFVVVKSLLFDSLWESLLRKMKTVPNLL